MNVVPPRGYAAATGSVGTHATSGWTRISLGALATLALWVGVALVDPSLAAATPTWLPSQQPSDAGKSVSGPTVATDAQGTVIVVWTRSDGTNQRVEARVRPPGGTFGPEQFLSAAGASAQGGSVVFDAQGNAIVTWSRGGIAQWAGRPAGGSFGPGQDLSPGGEQAAAPRVIFDSHGDAVAMWTSTVINASVMPVTEMLRLRYAVRPAGGAFGAAQQLDVANTSNVTQNMIHFFVAPLAADAQGDVFAAWSFASDTSTSPGCTSSSCTATSIKASVLPGGGSFSAPTTLASADTTSPTSDVVDSATLAADPQGDALAMWDRHNSTTEGIEGKLRPAGGSFEASPEPITGDALLPQVAMDSHGNAIVVFQGDVSGTVKVQEAERPAGGGFGLKQPLSTVASNSPTVALNAHGDAVAAWVQGNAIESATRPAGGSFGSPMAVSGAGGPASGVHLVADGQGDVVAAWFQLQQPGNYGAAGLAAYDAAGPAMQGLSIPGEGTAGSPVALSVAPVDVWSAVPAVTWTFGDGASADGANVSHTYGAAGTYPVTVTATDAVGNSTVASGSTQIAAAPPPVIIPTKANISGVGETNATFAVGSSSTPLTAQAAAKRHKRGTVFRFTLDQAATVTIAIRRKTPGRRVGRTCRPNSHKLRHKRPCTRLVKVAALTRTGHAGINTVAFTGRIRGKALKPGHYQAAFTAVDAAGVSAPKTLSFKIVRR
jgi:hypothetical protein